MAGWKERLHAYSSGWQQNIFQFLMGGTWALSQPLIVQRNLGYFWLDGFFANASDAILLTYLTLYFLSLGASDQQIGLVSGLASLSATILLMPGALLVERFGHRKWITVAAGGIISRIMIALFVLTPLFLQGQLLIYALMAFEITRQGFINLALPAWTSLTGDLVPIARRGTYFASRNIIMSLASIMVTIYAGQLITRTGTPFGYQLALGLAFGFGAVSTFFFSRIHEKPPSLSPRQNSSFKLKDILQPLIENRQLLAICGTAALWNFALNISGPFFSVYQAKNLMLTPAVIGLLSTVSSIAGLPAQRIMGPLADRLGPYKVQKMMGLLIPLLPLSWYFVTNPFWAPWQITVINIIGGFFWAGFSLASFNMLLAVAPAEQRARISALYQMIVAISLAVGAILGGFVVSNLGFRMVFLLSAVGRWIAAILFARFVKPIKQVES